MNLMALVPMPYRMLGLALLAIALWCHGWVKGANHGEAKLAAFTESVRAEGIKAQAMANARIAADRQRKETADREREKTIANLGARITSMRNANTNADRVPPAPASSPRPDLACFDRAEYQRAYGEFVKGLRGLADEGTAATVDLDNAKGWAR
jgi:hypothetical protein